MNPAETVPRQVLGLDARALLAQVCLRPVPQTSALLRAWVPPDAAELAPLFPQLEIVALQGRGGMGAVYKARQAGLERDVAIKILPPEAALDEAFAERFRAEARALAKMEHPNIVTVHESGQTAAGHLYFIMEYVDGSDLAHLMAEGAVPARQALTIVRDVCAALDYAHARGIVHRDIKPANVLLRNDGAVKVVDFGLSCLAAKTHEDTSRLTEAGSGLGTPVYMAPEQRAGSPVDGRADIYSLGVMIYEMLTGELPQGTWCAPSRKVRCTRRFDAAISRALQPEPAHRIPSAATFRQMIENELSGRNSTLVRRRLLLLGGSAAALAAGGWGWRRFGAGTPVTPGSENRQLITAPGTHELLSELDLPRAVISGDWQWLDDLPERILTVSYTPERPTAKVLQLPAAPGDHAYELGGELQLDSMGSDLTVVFPAGRARAALVLDLKGYSGIEAIDGADWKSNPTTLQRRIPFAKFLPFLLTVQPDGSRMRLSVHLDNQPFIQWEGLQSSLTLPEADYPDALMPKNERVPVLLSRKGGMRLRGLILKIGP
jgi:serine/threonine protein kinase